VFVRLLLLAFITLLILRAVSARMRRKSVDSQASQDLGVDPNDIRDAEFTEVRETEEKKA